MPGLFDLTGRTALVTGGSRGLGRMIAHGLLAQGAKVYISARKAQACEEAAASLSAFGPCVALPADVSTLDGIHALRRQFDARETTLDILVHNAGAVWTAPFDQFPESGWDKVMALNLKSPFFLTQALHPVLKAAAAAGRAKVVMVASVDGLAVNPLETYSYAASKAALVHLTRRLALRLIADDIVVNGVAPGEFPSEMNRSARDRPDETGDRVPARRVGSPQDIAGAVVYLASRAGDYVVGHTLVVDGGLSLGRGPAAR